MGLLFWLSAAPKIDDPRDKMADLDILLVHERDNRSSASTSFWHLPTMGDLLSMPCLVHRGFQGALDRVWDQVVVELTRYRRESPEGEICLTGHSLGGALALLTYSRLSDPNVAAYTLGARALAILPSVTGCWQTAARGISAASTLMMWSRFSIISPLPFLYGFL